MRKLPTSRTPSGLVCLGGLFCWIATSQANEDAHVSPPLTIVTSGRAVSVPLSKEVGEAKQVVLSALGRHWAGSSGIEKQTATFEVPAVRVRTTFQVIDPFRPKQTLGEVIAYPAETGYPTGEKFVVSLGPSVPNVFREFLTVHKIPFREWSGENPPEPASEPGLLIVGKEEAGETFQAARDLRLTCGRNLLVLNAAWYTPIEPQYIRIEPWWRFGEDGQPNYDPPREKSPQGSTIWNARFDRYWAGVATRKDYLFARHEDNATPSVTRMLLEHVWVLPTGEGIYLSYLDWESLLGRSDEIDYWFPRLIHGLSISKVEDHVLEGFVQIAWPPLESITTRERPVLAALADAKGAEVQDTTGKFPSLTVLDLRGLDLLPEEAARIKLPEPLDLENTREEHVMVLGSDEHLHDGIWAKDAPHKLAFKKYEDQYQLERSSNDQLPLSNAGTFTDAASRMQQVYCLTSIWTLYEVFIPPRQLEIYPEPGDANAK